MNETEVKYEFPISDKQCRVCLSVGRKLFPLGEYLEMFKIIMFDCDYQSVLPDSLLLCWECVAVLRKVCLFKKQFCKAYETLQSGQIVYGPLSSLITIILNDAHSQILYMHETNLQADRKETHYDEVSDHNDGDDLPLADYDFKKETLKSDRQLIPKVEPKTPKKNRWATKRALLNKKPKFKIVTDCKKTGFYKIDVKSKDLSLYLEKQRESEYFKSRRHKCTKCVLTFDDDKALARHNENHHFKVAPYTCDICDSRISSKRRLIKHIGEHYNRYACRLCDFTCCDKSQIQSHRQKKHTRIFQCVKCELNFGSRKEFFKHYKEWHEKFICDYCGVSFKMRYCIKNHIRKQHSGLWCVSCNKRFARYSGLWLHNKTAHARGAAPAYCVECDRRYPDQYRYRWHLANSARHNRRAKTRVPCPGCDKVFSKNIYMKDHYNLVHLKYFKYRCERCNKNFIRNADLVKHTRRVHEGILPPKNKICYMCGRGFSTNKILSNHVRTHTGERPHACDTCGARFAQSAALTAHARAAHAHGHTH
ncbi:unnamed protein product [Arctia plantaginis]|uniref:C2H2-type domain-containing protein n=1 Tax=Arctia plantaginis TaxID=874455 RepID=A0A8S1AFX4_ARCPL|nr:unnamed protein product [Arctia plantaginis]